MKATYTYQPSSFEMLSRQESLTILAGAQVRLSKAPAGGRGLPKKFRWIEDLNGNFLGMVTAESIVRN